MEMRAQLKWTDGFQFVGQANDGPATVIDSRDGRSGPTPMEMILMGVAACTAMDVIVVVQKKRIELTGFEINITGQRAEEHPQRYTDIHIEYVLHGPDITPKAVERAIELSETKYCSAIASLNAHFDHAYRIVKEQGKE
jgi:putative redox protein